jgi:hypothetical protein
VCRGAWIHQWAGVSRLLHGAAESIYLSIHLSIYISVLNSSFTPGVSRRLHGAAAAASALLRGAGGLGPAGREPGQGAAGELRAARGCDRGVGRLDADGPSARLLRGTRRPLAIYIYIYIYIYTYTYTYTYIYTYIHIYDITSTPMDLLRDFCAGPPRRAARVCGCWLIRLRCGLTAALLLRVGRSIRMHPLDTLRVERCCVSSMACRALRHLLNTLRVAACRALLRSGARWPQGGASAQACGGGHLRRTHGRLSAACADMATRRPHRRPHRRSPSVRTGGPSRGGGKMHGDHG